MIPSKNTIIASAGPDNQILIWDLNDEVKTISTLSKHKSPVNDMIIYSSDKNILISGGMDNKIIVWNLETGSIIKMVDASSSIKSLINLDYDPNQFVSLASSQVKFWDFKTLVCKNYIKAKKNEEEITAIVNLKNQKNLLAFGYSKGLIRIFDVEKFIEIADLKDYKNISLMPIFSLETCESQPNLLFSADNCDMVLIWDLKQMKSIKNIKVPIQNINCLYYISIKNQLVVGGSYKTEDDGSLFLIDIDNGNIKKVFFEEKPIFCSVLEIGNSLLLGTSKGGIYVFDQENCKIIKSFRKHLDDWMMKKMICLS